MREKQLVIKSISFLSFCCSNQLNLQLDVCVDSSRLSEDEEQEEQSEKEELPCGEEDFEVWKIVNNQEHFEFVSKLWFKYVCCSLS